MKFRYYITDTTDGVVKGTDDNKIAEEFAQSEDYFVIDTHTGEWILMDDERAEIQGMD